MACAKIKPVSRSIVSSAAKRKAEEVSACGTDSGLSTLQKAADSSAVAVAEKNQPLFVSSAPPPVRSASVLAARKIQLWSKESLNSSSQQKVTSETNVKKRRMTTKLQFVNDKTVPRIVRLENYKPTSSSFGQVYSILKEYF